MAIQDDIKALAAKYASELKAKVDTRVAEMKTDDTSHYLIYKVLGITDQEGELIDVYQNKGRFLYKYAGSFLEEVTKLCFKAKYPESASQHNCVVGTDAIEIKWRDATTDGDHITKEHTRLKTVKNAGFHPIRVMFYYPNRDQAIRIHDPPFFTQRKQALLNRDRTKEFTFDDRWRSASHYSSFLCDRLVQFHRVLKPTGSIFFHCDKTASHLARLVLDEVFGERNFQSEIIWSYKRWSNSARNLLPAHQTILFYAKGRDFKFNKLLTDYSPTTNVDQILQRRSRDATNKSVYERDQNGDVVFSGCKQGVPLSDVWEIPFLNPKAKERTGYPTQKPILLLEQIIRLCTDEGDTVLDPFCGSGTTLVAASLMNRSAIGIDISEEAVELTRCRLAQPVKTESSLMKNGIDSYRNANENALSLLNGIPHTPVQRNNGIDAFLIETYRDVPIPVRVQRHGETVADAACALHKAARTKNAGRMILIATEDQPSLFPLEIPEEIVVIPSAVLGMSRSIKLLKDQKETSNNAMHTDGNSAPLHSRR